MGSAQSFGGSAYAAVSRVTRTLCRPARGDQRLAALSPASQATLAHKPPRETASQATPQPSHKTTPQPPHETASQATQQPPHKNTPHHPAKPPHKTAARFRTDPGSRRDFAGRRIGAAIRRDSVLLGSGPAAAPRRPTF